MQAAVELVHQSTAQVARRVVSRAGPPAAAYAVALLARVSCRTNLPEIQNDNAPTGMERTKAIGQAVMKLRGHECNQSSVGPIAMAVMMPDMMAAIIIDIKN